MFTIKKLLIGLLTFFTLTILLYSSYVYSSLGKNFEAPTLIDKSIGSYDIADITENAKIHIISELDTVYTSGNVQISETIINLAEGVHILRLLGHTPYTVNGASFSFDISSPITAIVVINEKRVHFVPLNHKISLSLLEESGETVNTVTLYPHMYYSYHKNFIDNVRYGDVYLVELRHKLDYIHNSIMQDTSSFSKALYLLEEEEQQVLTSLLDKVSSDKNNFQNQLESFLAQKVVMVGGQQMIEKYFFLFMNPEKQVAYHKNLVLKDFMDFLKNGDKKNYSSEILSRLEEIKKIDKQEAEELETLLKDKLQLYIKGVTSDSTKKIALYNFFYNLQSSQHILENESLVIQEGYDEYDWENGNAIFSTIRTMSESFLQEEDTTKKGYMVFFLHQVLAESSKMLSLEKKFDTENMFPIFDNYTKLSLGYYSGEDIDNDYIEEVKKQRGVSADEISVNSRKKIRYETGIKDYGLLINSIAESLKIGYFEKAPEKSYLVRNQNPAPNRETLETFKENIDKILRFYQRYSPFVSKSPNVTAYSKRFSIARSEFDEYIFALEDYDKYRNTSDEKNKDFIINSSEKQKSSLKEKYVTDLFSQFNGINTSTSKISIKGLNYCLSPETNATGGEDYCFLVENIKIGNNFFNFLLFPSEQNKISNIRYVRNKNESYLIGNELKLDRIKDRYREDDLSKYYSFILQSFTNFANKAKAAQNESSNGSDVDLSDVFNDTKDGGNTNENYQQQELLRTVKNTLLLGKNGTFTQANDYLEVEYNDISIQESSEKNQYNIYLKDVDLNLAGSDNSLSGVLNSQYVFKAGTVSSFKSPKIKVDYGSSELGFYNYSYELIGIIPIAQFKSQVQKIASLTKDIEQSVSLANKYAGPGELTVKYFLNNDSIVISYGKLSYSFNSKTKLVKSIRYNGKNYLTKLASFDNLETYFKEINN